MRRGDFPSAIRSRERKRPCSLEDKIAVVTGGASGIGEATARRFARRAKAAIGDLRDASATAREIGGLAVNTDVSRENQVEDLLESALREFGRLDIVVNNTGVGAGDFLASLSERELDTVLAVNLKGTVWGIKHAAPRISEGGSIMSTASIAGSTRDAQLRCLRRLQGRDHRDHEDGSARAGAASRPRQLRVSRYHRHADDGVTISPRSSIAWPKCRIRSGGWGRPRRWPRSSIFWRATRAPSSPVRPSPSTAECRRVRGSG